MRKILLIAAIFFVGACNSPESQPTGSDVPTNTPPTGTTDTSGGARTDTSHSTDSLSGTHRTGPDSVR